MSETPHEKTGRDEIGPEPRDLPPAARRALEEAAARRAANAALTLDPADRPAEVNGRNGPEPARYGDWEKNGIISDF